MEKIYTKTEILAMKRGPSLFPPIIANMYHGRVMLFHDKQGGSVRVANDVTAEDSTAIWFRISNKSSDKVLIDTVQFKIIGSKGISYTVSMHNSQWNCNCSGFQFRRKCKHIEIAKKNRDENE